MTLALWLLKKYLNKYSILFIPLISFLADIRPLSDNEVSDLLSNAFIVDIKYSIGQVKKSFGNPLRTRTEYVDNPYNVKNKDIVTYITYPGLEIVFYDCRNPEILWEKIVEIKVSNNNYKLKYGLKIGIKRSDIDILFDGREKFVYEKKGLEYVSFQMNDSVHDQIIFQYDKNIVKEIILSNWP